jgi:DNA-directed RNA polymerase I subunit RPA49
VATIDARNIPPYDSFANTPPEAYPLDRIILSGEWDFLEDIYKSLQAGEVASNAYPTFVCKRIHKLLEIQVKWNIFAYMLMEIHFDYSNF